MLRLSRDTAVLALAPALGIVLALTGTVGALAPADKHVLYSRNRTGVASAARHCESHPCY